MADNGNGPAVRVEDLLPVRSRVSWGAIFAGAVVAMAAYLVLTLLGGAIGMSVGDSVRTGTLAGGAAFWAVLTTIVALFLGGWVTTQCAVGENKTEAVVHGVIMWGAVLAMMMWLVATGIRTGFNAMMGVAYAGAAVAREDGNWEESARRAGVSQETINEWRRKANEAPDRAREAANDPSNREAASQAATQVTWWTLLGTVLSLAASVAGALVGSGPSFRLLGTQTAGTRAGSESRQYAGHA